MLIPIWYNRVLDGELPLAYTQKSISFVLQYNGARRDELIFAQESMTELVMMDITGKVVFKTNVVLNGNIAEINFGDLESGLYLVDFGGERSRVQVMR